MSRLKDKWSQRIRLPSGHVITRDVKRVSLRDGKLHGRIKLDQADKHYLLVTSDLNLSEWEPSNPNDPDLRHSKWRSSI